jgi:hypothetical protein
MYELHISTMLVANNLVQKESQSAIVRTTKKKFGEDSIIQVSFGHTLKHMANRQVGQCYIQCLNAAGYT